MNSNTLKIKGKEYQLPIYLPDATRAVVRALDSTDLANVGIDGAVVNTYHLMTEPGMEVLKNVGGIKKFMNFDGLITSDSGGWQVYSLIHRNKNKGKITDDGVVFSIGGAKNQLFTPEKSIQVQFDIGADIIVCLDDFTDPTFDGKKTKESMDRTILWAKRCRKEFDRLIKEREIEEKDRPLLFAVIQGGNDKKDRKYCAEKLFEIGFDGYGYGGYAIRDGKLDLKLSKYIVDLIPEEKLSFALGVGRPNDIAALSEMGWDIFDCVLPTRDARHKRLYNFTREPKTVKDLTDPELCEFVYLGRRKHANSNKPLSEFCDCHVCKNFSLGYLFHLFDIGDFSAHRLATIHNLRVYSKVIEILRKGKK